MNLVLFRIKEKQQAFLPNYYYYKFSLKNFHYTNNHKTIITTCNMQLHTIIIRIMKTDIHHSLLVLLLLVVVKKYIYEF